MKTSRTHRLAMFTVAAIVVFSTGSWLRAAPFTFAFDVTISSVEDDLSEQQLSFSLRVGDVIRGEYSIASEEDFFDVFFHQYLGKQAQLTLDVEGFEIHEPINFGMINQPPVDINSPPTVPRSAISLAYIPITNSIPGWGGRIFPGFAGPWAASIVLVGPDGTVSDPHDVFDVSVWNQLTMSRELEILFGYPNSLVVHATGGEIRAVPEPTLAVTAVVAVILTSTWIRRLRLTNLGNDYCSR